MARTSATTKPPAKRAPRKATPAKAVTKTPAKRVTKAPVKKTPAKKATAAKTPTKRVPTKRATRVRPRTASTAPKGQPIVTEQHRLNALEQRVDALEGGRPGRKPLPILAIRQRDVCGIDPNSDSQKCPFASVYRYQNGCWGARCRLKQHEAYERRKKPSAPPPPVAKRRIVKKVVKASAA